MSQDQVSSGKASATGSALEGLLICVGAFMAFQVLQPGKGTSTDGTYVRSGFVSPYLLGLLGDGLRGEYRCRRWGCDGRNWGIGKGHGVALGDKNRGTFNK